MELASEMMTVLRPDQLQENLAEVPGNPYRFTVVNECGELQTADREVVGSGNFYAAAAMLHLIEQFVAKAEAELVQSTNSVF